MGKPGFPIPLPVGGRSPLTPARRRGCGETRFPHPPLQGTPAPTMARRAQNLAGIARQFRGRCGRRAAPGAASRPGGGSFRKRGSPCLPHRRVLRYAQQRAGERAMRGSSILFGVALSKKPAFWQAGRLPKIVCSGRAGGFAPPEGMQPLQHFLVH